MIPMRCNRAPVCQKRVSRRQNITLDDQRCPKCGEYSLRPENYRLQGRKAPNKDNAPRCDCNGPKAKDDPKFIFNQGVRIVLGPHRKGQAGCRHSPTWGQVEDDGYREYLKHLKEVEEMPPF